mmetsp:Transcript_10710/g.20317  ORF Transcript_10710/g.20317 Transcript_10710/m.20317 type:complete len:83 (-) Transcript_10710:17-265(-)
MPYSAFSELSRWVSRAALKQMIAISSKLHAGSTRHCKSDVGGDREKKTETLFPKSWRRAPAYVIADHVRAVSPTPNLLQTEY